MVSTIAGFVCSIAIVLMASSPAPAAARTTVVVFRPWTEGRLAAGYTISQRVTGSCWTHSLASDRPDAWRCVGIYDPCFGPPKTRVVACAVSPFSKSVVLLSLKSPLEVAEDPTAKMLQPSGEPWGLRLTNGDTCVFVVGATDAVHDQRLNYACRRSGWIIGQTDRSTATWTAHTVQWPKTRVTSVQIAVAIF